MADALSVTPLAYFPAVVTKSLANTQSICGVFCLNCQKIYRRDSILRIARYCPNIISTLLILCEQYDAPISSPDDYLLIPHYSQEKLIKNALSLCFKLCKHLEILSQQADQQLAKDIIHFITINISDINLSSQMIAEHFNCSISYLNKYFKVLIGTTPTAYIDKKRLSMAAALVIDSDLQIKEICCQVGYCDVNNFIRKFKKTYGTSPLQYRRQSLK